MMGPSPPQVPPAAGGAAVGPLVSLLLRRTALFITFTTLTFFSAAAIVFPQLRTQPKAPTALQSSSDTDMWVWACVLFLLWQFSLVLDVCSLSRDSMYYFSFVKMYMSFFSALVIGCPVGYCVQQLFVADFSSEMSVTGICMLTSVLSLMFLGGDLEHRLCKQFSSIRSTPLSHMPLSRCDIKCTVHAIVLGALCAVFVSFYCGCPAPPLCLLYSAIATPLVISALKIYQLSMFINLILHPIDFEKVEESTWSTLINSSHDQDVVDDNNYFLKNWGFILLLNSVSEGLGFTELTCRDFMKSFERDVSAMDCQSACRTQNDYVDKLYLTTNFQLDGNRRSLFNIISMLGVPRPTAPRRGRVMSIQSCSSSPSNSKGRCLNLCKFFFRSFALRDVCRIARVSPRRRAVIYRNPLLLHQNIYALCSLLDFYAAQVQLYFACNVAGGHGQAYANDIGSDSLFDCCVAYLSPITAFLFPEENFRGKLRMGTTSYDAEVRDSGSSSTSFATRARCIVKSLCGVREKRLLLVSGVLSFVLNFPYKISRAVGFDFEVQAAGLLSPLEVVDVINAADALSLFLVKSLSEDVTGQTFNFFPCALTSLMRMSIALDNYSHARSNVVYSSKIAKNLLNQGTKCMAAASFDVSDEVGMLKLAVEESAIRILRSNADLTKSLQWKRDMFPPEIYTELTKKFRSECCCGI